LTGQYPAANSYPEMEKAWNEYFSDPTQWWDNRGKKVSTRAIVSDESEM